MVDPFTAFSAAGNVLQFAELGAKFIREAVHYANSGGSDHHQAIQDIVQSLSVSNAHLQSHLETDAAVLDKPGPARALFRANQDCLRVSNELTKLLDKLRPKGSRSLWRNGEK
jgi:hypothetical protein